LVVSITRKTPVTATAINNTSVTYLVTFSEAVTGVDASDFELTKTGSADVPLPPFLPALLPPMM
jgi:hypothetical protein